MRQWRIDYCSVTVIMATLITGVDLRFPAGVSIGSWSLSPGTVVSDSMYLGSPVISTSWSAISICYNRTRCTGKLYLGVTYEEVDLVVVGHDVSRRIDQEVRIKPTFWFSAL